MVPSAPTGQESTHWPQNSQSRVSSKAGLIFVLNPRPIRFIAPTPWCSLQTLTHLPHRMQRFVFLSISGAASDSGSFFLSPVNLL